MNPIDELNAETQDLVKRLQVVEQTKQNIINRLVEIQGVIKFLKQNEPKEGKVTTGSVSNDGSVNSSSDNQRSGGGDIVDTVTKCVGENRGDSVCG